MFICYIRFDIPSIHSNFDLFAIRNKSLYLCLFRSLSFCVCKMCMKQIHTLNFISSHRMHNVVIMFVVVLFLLRLLHLSETFVLSDFVCGCCFFFFFFFRSWLVTLVLQTFVLYNAQYFAIHTWRKRAYLMLCLFLYNFFFYVCIMNMMLILFVHSLTSGRIANYFHCVCEYDTCGRVYMLMPKWVMWCCCPRQYHIILLFIFLYIQLSLWFEMWLNSIRKTPPQQLKHKTYKKKYKHKVYIENTTKREAKSKWRIYIYFFEEKKRQQRNAFNLSFWNFYCVLLHSY